MTMAKMKLLTFLGAVLAPLASAQSFDNTGNKLLNGAYYFREVAYTSNVDVAVFGSITFDGNGNYSITGTTYDDSSFSQQPFSATGTYVISASGFGYLSSNQLLSALGSSNPVTHGLVTNNIFVGSSTESGINDMFIAAPIASQTAGTLNGAYTLNYMDPIGALTGGTPFDALLTMNANGGGGIGTVNVSAYSTDSTALTQSIGSVNYITSNNAFVLQFPGNSNSALIQGNEYLYSSADGSFVFGGAPDNVDMIIGVRNGSSGSNFGGLYYQAGIAEDLSQLASTGQFGLDTYYGSFNADAADSVTVGHQRVLSFGTTPYGFTYADFSQQNSSGTYNDSDVFLTNYIGGSGGTIQIGYGVGPEIGLTIGVQAPNLTGGGVYLNPTGVINAASSAPFTAGVSPGELITLVGTNIGPSNLQVTQTLPFPPTLGGVQVLINNFPAPIYYVSSNQLAVIVPYEIASASIAQIQVFNNQTPSNLVTEYVNTTTPGIFTEPAGGVGDAAALHQDYSLVSSTSPAQVGETVAVYVTGLGSVLGNIADGAAGPTQPYAYTSNTITAAIDGVAASVSFAGLAPGLAGLYQVNVTVPSGVTLNNDDYLELIGPDSDTYEAGIPIGSGSVAQARGMSANHHPRPHRSSTGMHRRVRKTQAQ